MRAIGYVRVSTEQQERSGLGKDAQVAAIHSIADREGLSVVGIAEDVASGKSTSKRPGLADALDRIEGGEAEALVVSKLDRLARSLVDFVGLAERARKRGWRLVVGDVPVDMSSPVGEALAGILGVFAQLERRLISERTKAARAAARAAGRPVGGRPEGVTRIPSEVLARIATERAAGASYRKIAEGLTADGIPTANGAARWAPETVRQTHRKFT
ncbi:recombinase family protein [Miltoncostaea marina]|uniref:recombinase family protein n=1 Tax=Miltoncostaea marina TaxID=2843215 RepID=UPI001FE4B421|nr:recombinase family protein [Miltoncostaea marina]